MGDIVEFLKARLDEDEAVANSLPEDEYEPDGIELLGCQGYPCEVYLGIGRTRVLRDIAAKRAIVDWCAEVIGDRDMSRYGEFGSLKDDPQSLATTLAMETLMHFAAIWAEHPDYDASWTVAD